MENYYSVEQRIVYYMKQKAFATKRIRELMLQLETGSDAGVRSVAKRRKKINRKRYKTSE